MGEVMRLHTIGQEASSMEREQAGEELGVENSAGSGHIVLRTAGFQLSVHFYIILPATLMGVNALKYQVNQERLRVLPLNRPCRRGLHPPPYENSLLRHFRRNPMECEISRLD